MPKQKIVLDQLNKDKIERILASVVTFIFVFSALALPPVANAEPLVESYAVSYQAFNIDSNYMEVGGQPTAPGAFKSNRNIANYVDGACIPFIIEAENTGSFAGDIVFAVDFNHLHNEIVGIAHLETLGSSIFPARDAMNLSQFNFSGANFAHYSAFLSSNGHHITADISGQIIYISRLSISLPLFCNLPPKTNTLINKR